MGETGDTAAASSPVMIGAADVARCLPWPALIAALRAGFAGPVTLPPRHHHALGLGETRDQVLLVMPAWSQALGIGTKLVTVFPGNNRQGRPAVHGLYILMDPRFGMPVAVLDGAELTARRTAATSALASGLLSRPDSRTLLMIGTGRLSAYLPLAHAETRPITRVLVWGRAPAKARQAAAALTRQGLNAEAAPCLEAAMQAADIISCATLAAAPILRGAWLRPGTHVDLVGAFTPEMRESDDETMRRAAGVWCDTSEGAQREAGDIIQSLHSGALPPAALRGDLFDLCRPGALPPARARDAITVFKSVGSAIEDLAAAACCLQAYGR